MDPHHGWLPGAYVGHPELGAGRVVAYGNGALYVRWRSAAADSPLISVAAELSDGLDEVRALLGTDPAAGLRDPANRCAAATAFAWLDQGEFSPAPDTWKA